MTTATTELITLPFAHVHGVYMRRTMLLMTVNYVYYTYKASWAHEQKAHGPAMHMHNGHCWWAWLRMTYKNTLFVTLVGCATQSETQ